MKIYLYAALALFAAGSPVVKWLIQEGGTLGLTAPGAISFCNVLFVGNLAGGIIALLLSGAGGTLREARAVDSRTCWLLLLNTLLGAMIPALIFTALKTTMITNLVLLSRVEPVAFALFTMLFFGAQISGRQWIGLGVILVGGLGLAFQQSMGGLARGDLLILLGAVLQAISVCISKKILLQTTRRVLIFVRNLGSAIVFFIIAVYLYGPGHFAAAFGPGLWVVMSGYALVIVVLAQICWFRALDTVEPAAIAKGLMVSPILGILFAFLILREVPSLVQVAAGVIIFAGIAMSREQVAKQRPSAGTPEQSLAAASH